MFQRNQLMRKSGFIAGNNKLHNLYAIVVHYLAERNANSFKSIYQRKACDTDLQQFITGADTAWILQKAWPAKWSLELAATIGCAYHILCKASENVVLITVLPICQQVNVIISWEPSFHITSNVLSKRIQCGGGPEEKLLVLFKGLAFQVHSWKRTWRNPMLQSHRLEGRWVGVHHVLPKMDKLQFRVQIRGMTELNLRTLVSKM